MGGQIYNATAWKKQKCIATKIILYRHQTAQYTTTIYTARKHDTGYMAKISKV